MKAYKITFTLVALLSGLFMQAQRYGYNNTATVVAQNYDVSENLDLQAVASIFGDSHDLEDFERRLNDPSQQISNLDLNRDNYVDYLRVIEVADNDARIVVIQAVLGQDVFQDVATIELERERQSNSTVHVQIVGNPYLYGANYIYEPYYYRRPVFFDFFWGASYSPYYSPWYWGYYPTYYSYWSPMPIHRYRRHITPVINSRNRYVYSDNRRISRADRIYSGVSRRGYEQANPNRSFTQRNQNATNRHSLENVRSTNGRVNNNAGFQNSRGNSNTRINDRATTGRGNETRVNTNLPSRNAEGIRNNGQVRSTESFNTSRVQRANAVSTDRASSNNRIERTSRSSNVRSENVRSSAPSRSNSSVRSSAPSSRSNSSMRSSAPTMRSSAPSPSMNRGGAMPSGGGRSGGSQRGR